MGRYGLSVSQLWLKNPCFLAWPQSPSQVFLQGLAHKGTGGPVYDGAGGIPDPEQRG